MFSILERTNMQNADVAVDFYHRYKVFLVLGCGNTFLKLDKELYLILWILLIYIPNYSVLINSETRMTSNC